MGGNAIAIAFVPFVFIPPAGLFFVISCAASAKLASEQEAAIYSRYPDRYRNPRPTLAEQEATFCAQVDAEQRTYDSQASEEVCTWDGNEGENSDGYWIC